MSSVIVQSLPKSNGEIANQLKRAALSIPVNIAEGAGKTGRADKKRFYAIARRSALECAAVIDALLVLELIDRNIAEQGKNLLTSVVCMLTKLCLSSYL